MPQSPVGPKATPRFWPAASSRRATSRASSSGESANWFMPGGALRPVLRKFRASIGTAGEEAAAMSTSWRVSGPTTKSAPSLCAVRSASSTVITPVSYTCTCGLESAGNCCRAKSKPA